MILPTVDQTEGIWIARTSDQGYHAIQEVFSQETEIERAHHANCRLLIQRGSLQPERVDRLSPSQRDWNAHRTVLSYPYLIEACQVFLLLLLVQPATGIGQRLPRSGGLCSMLQDGDTKRRHLCYSTGGREK